MNPVEFSVAYYQTAGTANVLFQAGVIDTPVNTCSGASGEIIGDIDIVCSIINTVKDYLAHFPAQITHHFVDGFVCLLIMPSSDGAVNAVVHYVIADRMKLIGDAWLA